MGVNILFLNFILLTKISLIMEQQKIIDNAETLAAKIVTVEFSSMKLNELLQLAEDTENTIEALQAHCEEL